MATLTSGIFIPSELIGLILSNISSRKHLIDVSLVSHSWQRLALPVLWQKVQLMKSSQMENFIKKLESEVLDTDLRISLHVSQLHVGRAHDSDLDRDLMVRFQQIIPKMVSLKHMSWRGYFPGGVPVFQTFQQSCPALRSIDLEYGGIGPLTEKQQLEVFVFKNLTHALLPAGFMSATQTPSTLRVPWLK
ncbi:hypothetical protein BDV93DRAFT_236576 [Ceratobasidium sp. AG-I]|nr:hypothetical protein BDV93DRAFT_236576 [Ceratobasidium sp. AG-I]